MTNYIEQLMKEAGVQKREIIDCCLPQEYFECQDKHNCAYCDKCRSIEYSAFTPTKQLELIKLIVDKCKDIKISKFQDTYTIGAIEDWGDYIHNSGELKNFTEAIAQITCTLIRFNELDKSEVKRILEDDTNL